MNITMKWNVSSTIGQCANRPKKVAVKRFKFARDNVRDQTRTEMEMNERRYVTPYGAIPPNRVSPSSLKDVGSDYPRIVSPWNIWIRIRPMGNNVWHNRQIGRTRHSTFVAVSAKCAIEMFDMYHQRPIVSPPPPIPPRSMERTQMRIFNFLTR